MVESESRNERRGHFTGRMNRIDMLLWSKAHLNNVSRVENGILLGGQLIVNKTILVYRLRKILFVHKMKNNSGALIHISLHKYWFNVLFYLLHLTFCFCFCLQNFCFAYRFYFVWFLFCLCLPRFVLVMLLLLYLWFCFDVIAFQTFVLFLSLHFKHLVLLMPLLSEYLRWCHCPTNIFVLMTLLSKIGSLLRYITTFRWFVSFWCYCFQNICFVLMP